MELAGRKFLITGGFGLVSSHLAEQLLAEEVGEVILFDNSALSSAQTVEHLLRSDKVRAVRGDITHLSQFMGPLEGVDGIFHTAGYLTLVLNQHPEVGLEVNIMGTYNVLEAARWQGVKKVVFSSSVATYGKTPETITTEESPLFRSGMPWAATAYAASKIIGEQICRLYQERYGVEFVALRYSTVYGERQHYRGVNVLYLVEAYDRIVEGLPPIIPGDGSEVHDYVYAGDVARANVLAMKSPIAGESFTIAGGVSTSITDLVSELLAATGSHLQPEYRAPSGRVAVPSGHSVRFSIDKARVKLGWEPTVDLREGIRRFVAWRQSVSSPPA